MLKENKIQNFNVKILTEKKIVQCPRGYRFLNINRAKFSRQLYLVRATVEGSCFKLWKEYLAAGKVIVSSIFCLLT